MAVKPILRMGDPRLLAVSGPVRDFGTPELQQLVAEEGGAFDLEAWDWRYYAEKDRKSVV